MIENALKDRLQTPFSLSSFAVDRIPCSGSRPKILYRSLNAVLSYVGFCCTVFRSFNVASVKEGVSFIRLKSLLNESMSAELVSYGVFFQRQEVNSSTSAYTHTSSVTPLALMYPSHVVFVWIKYKTPLLFLSNKYLILNRFQ